MIEVQLAISHLEEDRHLLDLPLDPGVLVVLEDG